MRRSAGSVVGEVGIKERDYVTGGDPRRWYCYTINTGACPGFVPANGGMDTGGDSVYTEEGVGE